MKKTVFLAITAIIIAVFAAGCNSTPKEKESEMGKMVIFRCGNEDYYDNAGFLEMKVGELNELVESVENDTIDNRIDCFIYDSINTYWVNLSSDLALNQFDSNWPSGQKYALIFFPQKRYISKITFIFNAPQNMDAKLIECAIEKDNQEFWVVDEDGIEALKNALSRTLSTELDVPMTRADTALMQELGLME